MIEKKTFQKINKRHGPKLHLTYVSFSDNINQLKRSTYNFYEKKILLGDLC